MKNYSKDNVKMGAVKISRKGCKITFLQPGYAHYRDQLFTVISGIYDIHFIYESSQK